MINSKDNSKDNSKNNSGDKLKDRAKSIISKSLKIYNKSIKPKTELFENTSGEEVSSEMKIEATTQNYIETQDWIIPNKFNLPEWVYNNLKVFKDKAKEVISQHKDSVTQNKNIKNLIETYIVNSVQFDIKIKYPITKSSLRDLVSRMWEKTPESEFLYRYWLLQEVGFFLSTFKPSGFEPESLKLPPKFIKIKEKILAEYQQKIKDIGKDKAISWVDKEFDKLTDDVIKYWEENNVNVVDILKSKARGSASDIRKMLVAVGLSITSDGSINDVIMDSQIEGLEQTQFFHYSSQAIQALYAKSAETAVPGYLARKISTIADGVNLSKEIDCGTKNYLEIEIFDESILSGLDGRMLSNGKIIDKNNKEEMKKLMNKKIKVRSPLYCKAKDGICVNCYNPKLVKKLGFESGEKVGLHATTLLGDQALVNITLKKSHTGLSLNLEEVNLQQDIFTYAE
jgi:hypothetical protein